MKTKSSTKKTKTRVTKFKGVYPTPYGTYRARVSLNGKTHNIGTYSTPTAASRAVKEYVSSYNTNS